MQHSTLTRKGQTTIPKVVRDLLNLRPGDRIDYVREAGVVKLVAANRSVLDLERLLPPPARPLTLDEIEAVIAERATRHVADEDDDRD